MKSKLKKGIMVSAAAALIMGIIPSATASECVGAELVMYNATDIPSSDYELDKSIDKAVLGEYGIHFNENPSGAIWSVMKKKDDYITQTSLRFSTQTTSGNPRDLNLMTLRFGEDTVNDPADFNGDGYTFESEFFALNRDSGYINLVFTGADAEGTSHDFAEIRLVPSDNNKQGRGGKAYAVDESGNQIGSAKDIILTSVSSDTDPEQMYYVRADFDFVNQKYSAWLMVRSSSDISYNESEPTVADKLVENADLNCRSIETFTGFEFNITKSEWGNGVWMKNAKVSEYTAPELDDLLLSAYYTDSGAMDNSRYAAENDMVEITNGSSPISYNDELNMYESSITTDTEYAYNAMLPVLRRSQMITSDGFTIECYAKPTDFPASSNVIFGAAQSGGFDIETNKSGVLGVYIRSTDDKWITDTSGRYPGGNYTLEANQYYHIVATATEDKIKVYINGECIDTVNSGSKLRFPSASNTKDYYGVYMGADYNSSNEYAQTPMTGSFVYGKIYTRALTDQEIKTEYDKLAQRKALTSIDALNLMLTKTLPDIKAEAGEDAIIDSFIYDGWLMMGRTDLTDDEINAFISEVNSYIDPKPAEATAETKEADIAKNIDGDVIINGEILSIENNTIMAGDRVAKVYKTVITAGDKTVKGGSVTAKIGENEKTDNFVMTIAPYNQGTVFSILSQEAGAEWLEPEWSHIINVEE